MKKIIASAVAAALIVLSPGFPCYQALAAEIEGPAGKGANGSGPIAAPKIENFSAPLAGVGLGTNGLPNTQIPGTELPASIQDGAVAANPLSPAANPAAAGLTPSARIQQAQLHSGSINAVQPAAVAPVEASAATQTPAQDKPGETAGNVAAIKNGDTARQLSDSKSEKTGLLSWIFDRVRRKGSDAAVEVPGVSDKSISSGLSPATVQEAAKALVPAPAKAAPAAPKKSVWEKAKSILDFSGYNRTQKAFLIGQIVFIVGIAIYMTSMPLLVSALTGSTAFTGTVRLVHYVTLGAASLVSGEVVKRSSMKGVLTKAGRTRAAIYGAIGVLALALGTGMPLPLFLGLVGLNALVVAHNHLVDIDAGGAAKVFPDKAQRQQAFYQFLFVRYGALLVVPWVFGFAADKLDLFFGAGTGAKAGMILLSGALATAAWMYSKMQLAADENLPGTSFKLKDFPGMIRDTPGRIARTAKAIWSNGKVRIRVLMSMAEQFLEDALFFVVMPTFAVDILGQKNMGNGLVLSATYLGGLLASKVLMKHAGAFEKKHGEYKLIAALSVLGALAFVPSIGLWAYPSIFVALPLVLLMKLMLAPIQAKMQSLLQTAIDEDPKAKAEEENIWSLITTPEVVAAGLGGLFFEKLFEHSAPGGFLYTVLGANGPMKVVSIALMAFSALYLGSLPFLKKQLGHPTRVVHPSPDGKQAEALAKLSSNLKRMGLPQATTEKDESPSDGNRPTVAILAPASVYKLAIAQEGGRQSSGDVSLVLDRSWLIHETDPDGKARLYMTKGLTFRDGRPVIVEYKNARPVHYFADFYTMGANDRDDGEILEKGLETPMSNSLQLEKITNDKLFTRIKLAAMGIGVPATLAFLMPAHALTGVQSASPTMQVETMPAERAQIKTDIERFLRSYKGEELVVKPSGPQFHSGRGVKFFQRGEVEAMVDHVLALKADKQMTTDGAILVDSRLAPPPVYLQTSAYTGGGTFAFVGDKVDVTVMPKSEIATAQPWEKKDWNLRVLAARAPSGMGVTTGIFARAGTWGLPTTAEAADPRNNAAVVSLEDVITALREQHGLLKTDAQAEAFIADLKKMGADAVNALAKNEKERTREEGEPSRAQTDYIGLDVMVELEGGKLTPKIIEVNDHDAGGQWQLDAFYQDRQGEHSKEWIATALERARLDALRGKRIILVGAGYSGKRFVFERAKELGVKIVLVDKGLPAWKRMLGKMLSPFGVKFKDHWARDLVDEFVNVDNSDHKTALSIARKKLLRSARKNGRLGGIATFWEDDVPLAAQLAEALKLPYHTVAAANAVRSKYQTRQVMHNAGLPTPRYMEISKPEDVETAIASVGFPAVIKPAFGAEAMGVVRVNNADEARAAYKEIVKLLNPEVDKIFVYGSQMVFEQYLQGDEWDADLVMQDGKAAFASVTDNWPTREPHFIATGSSLPSRTMNAAQVKEVEDLAIKTAQALGLRDGVVHIEGKYTKEGARIIEANGRMGGVYVRDWVKSVWGVDLVDQQLLVAGGIPVAPYKPAQPLTYLEGEFVIPEQHGILSAFGVSQEGRESEGFHEIREVRHVGEELKPPFQSRVGMIVARGGSSSEAQKNLDQLRAQMILEVKPNPQPQGKH